MSPSKLRGPMPPEIRRKWEEGLADADHLAIDANFAKSEAAAAEDSFSGFIRRCVHQRGMPLTDIANEAHLDVTRFADFLRGDGVLDTAELDRLISVLQLDLAAAARN